MTSKWLLVAIMNRRPGGEDRRGQEERTSRRGQAGEVGWKTVCLESSKAQQVSARSCNNGPVMVLFRTVAIHVISNITQISALLHCSCYHGLSVAVAAVRTGVRMNRVCVLPMVKTEAGWNGGEGKLILKCPPQQAMNSTISAKS